MSMAEGTPEQARFSDGFKAEVVQVSVTLALDGLLIATADGRRWQWPLAAVRRVPEEAAELGLRLSSALQPDARLVLPDRALLPDLRRLCHDLDGDPGAVRKAVRLALSVASVLALLLGAYFGLPLLASILAPAIPDGWQRGLGARAEAALASVLAGSGSGGHYCAAPAGTAALARLMEPLVSGARLAETPRIAVLDAGLINAFALPGNRILVTRGMIELAQDPNELAGVIAHELGHLQHGDPLAALIARFEWNAVTTLLFGGGSLSNFGETVVLMSYSRGREARADESGVAILRQAQIGSGGFAAIMRRMGAGRGTALSYLESHPQAADRVATIERLGGTGAAALPQARWLDLKRICTEMKPL